MYIHVYARLIEIIEKKNVEARNCQKACKRIFILVANQKHFCRLGTKLNLCKELEPLNRVDEASHKLYP